MKMPSFANTPSFPNDAFPGYTPSNYTPYYVSTAPFPQQANDEEQTTMMHRPLPPKRTSYKGIYTTPLFPLSSRLN